MSHLFEVFVVDEENSIVRAGHRVSERFEEQSQLPVVLRSVRTSLTCTFNQADWRGLQIQDKVRETLCVHTSSFLYPTLRSHLQHP